VEAELLEREADGVQWWLDRQALENMPVPPPTLVLTWVSIADPALVAHRVAGVVDEFEARAAGLPDGLTRDGMNVDWAGSAHGGRQRTSDAYPPLLARFVEEAGDAVNVWWMVQAPQQPAELYWQPSISLSAVTNYLRPGVWEWYLFTSPGLYRDERRAPAGTVFAAMLGVAAGWPETIWGAIFDDHWARNQDLPFERYFGVEHPPEDSARLARGYYWANLLTEQHLDALGGPDALAGRCRALGLTCDLIDGRVAAIVKAGGPIDAFDDDKLVAVRDLLTPLLDPTPYTQLYAGPPLRVLKQPGTAFRRIPPDIEVPRFADQPPLGDDAGSAWRLVPDDV
jgi:hypothetical protein